MYKFSSIFVGKQTRNFNSVIELNESMSKNKMILNLDIWLILLTPLFSSRKKYCFRLLSIHFCSLFLAAFFTYTENSLESINIYI